MCVRSGGAAGSRLPPPGFVRGENMPSSTMPRIVTGYRVSAPAALCALMVALLPSAARAATFEDRTLWVFQNKGVGGGNAAWGDVNNDNTCNVFDIMAVIEGANGEPSPYEISFLDLIPDHIIEGLDILAVIDAATGNPFSRRAFTIDSAWFGGTTLS